MALTKTITFDNGIKCNDAYLKVVSIQLDFEQKTASIRLNTFKDKSSRDSGLKPINSESFFLTDLTANDSIKSVYSIGLNFLASDSIETLILNDLTLTAGTDFKIDTNFTQNIIDAINASSLKDLYVATFNGQQNIILTAINAGEETTPLAVSGTAIQEAHQLSKGSDAIPAYFTKYMLAGDARENSYTYLKTLSQFKDAVDA